MWPSKWPWVLEGHRKPRKAHGLCREAPAPPDPLGRSLAELVVGRKAWRVFGIDSRGKRLTHFHRTIWGQNEVFTQSVLSVLKASHGECPEALSDSRLLGAAQK